MDLIIRNIIQLQKSDPRLENECPLVFLKLKLGCLRPALVTVFLTASPFTDLIQCISLTFITYSTSFLKTVVIVWLNPFPPAKSCVCRPHQWPQGPFCLVDAETMLDCPSLRQDCLCKALQLFTWCYCCIFKGRRSFFCLSWSCSNFFLNTKWPFACLVMRL